MARCSRAHHWAEEPLVEEILYKSDDIIVENSDIEGSANSQDERNRRREAIGRRYLLGHIPLIQTASLRGPFDSNSGWTNPWRRIQTGLKAQQSPTSTRNVCDHINTKETIDTRSRPVEVESIPEAHIEEGFHDKHIDDDAVRYDADNEHDAFEEMDNEGYHLLDRIEHWNEIGAKQAYLFHDKAQSWNSDDDNSNALKEDFERPSKRNSPGKAGQVLLPKARKRKVDMAWLKRANVLKRSRYGLLEHSSPTPATGIIRDGNREHYSGSSRQRSGLEISSGQGHSQVLQIPNINKSVVQRKAANIINTHPAILDGHDGISWEVAQESTQNILEKQNVNGFSQAPQSAIGGTSIPIFTQSSGTRQLDVVLFSPSDPEVEDIRSSRRLLRQGVRSTTPHGEHQVLDNPAYLFSSISEANADEGNVLSQSGGNVNFRDTPSPASDESFHYRKTSRKCLGRKSSPQSHDREVKTGVGYKDVSTLKREAQILPLADRFLHHLSNALSSSYAGGLGAQKNATNRRTERDGRRQRRSASFESDLDMLSELGGASSPDPLSEDFRDDRQQQIIPPNVSPGVVQNLTEPSQENITAGDCQRTKVTQHSPDLRQQAGGTPQSALQGPVQQSISEDFENHSETSISPSSAIQCRLPGSYARRSVSPTRIENENQTPLGPRSHANRNFSQSQSPSLDNAATELSQGSRQESVIAKNPGGLKDNVELFQPPDIFRRDELLSEITPVRIATQVLEEPAGSTESPWTAVSVESLQPDFSLGFGSNSFKSKRDNSVTRRHLNDLPVDEAESATLTSKQEGGPDELGQPLARFPSTQTLVDAATTNPWNSAFKQSRRHKSDKRVSFSTLPSEGVHDAATDASLRPPEQMGSPPPPAGTLRLTQLDDPFHHRLKATRNLEVTEESLTKFMNTPWDDIPAIKPRAKPPASSPAVVAMAEAFIVADQQNLYEKFDNKERSKPARYVSTTTEPTEKFRERQSWVAPEQLELGSYSPPDVSFSIAPSGKVTAVSIEAPGHDAEDNLRAVIEDMGSFLEGWDVESELKKAKGHKLAKGNDVKSPRKREYLSGVLNR